TDPRLPRLAPSPHQRDRRLRRRRANTPRSLVGEGADPRTARGERTLEGVAVAAGESGEEVAPIGADGSSGSVADPRELSQRREGRQGSGTSNVRQAGICRRAPTRAPSRATSPAAQGRCQKKSAAA